MRKIPDFRLDVLIKKEDDYYIAHCLQFDLVATDDTLKGVQKSIIELCNAHIQFSYKNNNTDYLFSPAPNKIWNEYLALLNDPSCTFELKKLEIPVIDRKPEAMLPAFMVQEILCNVQPAC